MLLPSADLRVQAFGYVKEQFGLLWVRPWDNRGIMLHGSKENEMLVQGIAAFAYLHVYLQPFMS